jgi:hypothetical protein
MIDLEALADGGAARGRDVLARMHEIFAEGWDHPGSAGLTNRSRSQPVFSPDSSSRT